MTNVLFYSPLLQKSKSKLSRELSDLVVYCKSVHFHGFEHARSHAKCYEMSSFSESKAKRLAKEAGAINTRERRILSYSSDKIIYLFHDRNMLYMFNIVYISNYYIIYYCVIDRETDFSVFMTWKNTLSSLQTSLQEQILCSTTQGS